VSGYIRPGPFFYLAVAALLFAACGSPQALQEKTQGVEAIGQPNANGQIAFVRLDDSLGSQNTDIYLMDAEGNGELRLTDHPAVDVEPAWSPDGQNLAFSSDRHGKSGYPQIYTMTADGERIEQVTTGFAEADSPSWSPDGARIAFRAFSEAGDEIFTANSDGSDLVQVSNERDDGASGAYWPAWSPDGSRIAHKRIRYDAETQTDSEALYSMTSEGAEVERLTPEFFFDGAPTWSPDGSKIAFAARRNGEEAASIFVMNADGSGLSAVMEDGAGPSWSPDGTEIAFASARDGDSEIYVMSPDGSGVTQLTDNDLQDSEPAWQPITGVDQTNDKMSPPEYLGPIPGAFYPTLHREGELVVMPITFVDGGSAEILFRPDLRPDELGTYGEIAGGLGEVERSIYFRYGDGSLFKGSGPLESYEGSGGAKAEVWEPPPDSPFLGPNLVFRFGNWFVGVRTFQDELSNNEKAEWAQRLIGRETQNGFLVLDAIPPLTIAGTGDHDGTQVWLQGREEGGWPFITLTPLECDPNEPPSNEEVRVMEDGQKVSFARSAKTWSADWCEDGKMLVMVESPDQAYVEAAAEGLRVRNVSLGDS
jgi:hypothetical protein